MSDKIFVLAGNYDQFKMFRSTLMKTMIEEYIEPCRSSDIVYVRRESLLGHRNMWGYKVGTWYCREDIEEICHLLLSRQSSIEEFIEVEL
jgi:hypothetical protein